jgi:NAD(P)-dependent dehydrogenase (short-subunit alcohol dehydrogenase family)
LLAGAIATPLLLDFLASGSGDTVKQLTEEGAKIDQPSISVSTGSAAQSAAASSAQAGPSQPSSSTHSDGKPDISALSLAEAPASDDVTTAAAGGGSSEGEGQLKVPLRRVGLPEEIASCVVWLCMHGQYVTGTDVLVDGGSSCRVLTSSD